MATSNDPANAKAIVKAIGANILPSTPSSVKSGRNTTMIIAIENTIGRLTSLAES